MKQITMKELQTNISWLSDLPIELTRYGKVVAVIMPPISNKDLIMETLPVKKNIKNIKKDPTLLDSTEKLSIVNVAINKSGEFVKDVPLPTSTSNMGLWRCSHGNIGRMCKKEDCRVEARKHER